MWIRQGHNMYTSITKISLLAFEGGNISMLPSQTKPLDSLESAEVSENLPVVLTNICRCKLVKIEFPQETHCLMLCTLSATTECACIVACRIPPLVANKRTRGSPTPDVLVNVLRWTGTRQFAFWSVSYLFLAKRDVIDFFFTGWGRSRVIWDNR